MKIVVTGASGFVGKELVPLLNKAKIDLLLVGRDVEKLKILFPNNNTTSYKNLQNKAVGFEVLIHLAVINNGELKSIDQFREINVLHLLKVVKHAKIAGIKKFINFTTLHTMKNHSLSNYAQTKKEAEIALSKIKGISIINLRLPAVYGKRFSGKLKILSKFPKIFRIHIFQFLACFKPTLNIKILLQAILDITNSKIKSDIIVSDKQINNKFYKFLKRTIDLSFVIFVLMCFWWVLIFAWLAVKVTSSGPGILLQKRIGKNGVVFTLYKFRTMFNGTKEIGTHELTNDPITSVGRVLRKTKIDELPQIFNILKNELSLIGPRPCLPIQSDLISARHKLGVFEELGGITGLAQIKGVDMSNPDILAKLDYDYLVRRTIILDLKIIIATAIKSFRKNI